MSGMPSDAGDGPITSPIAKASHASRSSPTASGNVAYAVARAVHAVRAVRSTCAAHAVAGRSGQALQPAVIIRAETPGATSVTS